MTRPGGENLQPTAWEADTLTNKPPPCCPAQGKARGKWKNLERMHNLFRHHNLPELVLGLMWSFPNDRAWWPYDCPLLQPLLLYASWLRSKGETRALAVWTLLFGQCFLGSLMGDAAAWLLASLPLRIQAASLLLTTLCLTTGIRRASEAVFTIFKSVMSLALSKKNSKLNHIC